MAEGPGASSPAPPSRPSGPLGTIPSWLDRAAGWSWRFLAVAAAVALLAFILIELRIVVLPLIVALFLAAILEPPVRWVSERGVPRILATWLVLVAAVGVIVGLGMLLAPRVGDEFGQLGTSLERGLDEAQRILRDTFNVTIGDLEDLGARVVNYLRENAQAITGGVISGALLVAEIVAGMLLTAVILFFFLKDGPKITGWLHSRTPEDRRDLTRRAAGRVWGVLGVYLRGVAITGVVDGVAIAVGLLIIGVPLVAPLAVLTFFGAFFPLVGAFVAGLVAVLVALVAGGVVDALFTLALVVAVQQLEGDIVAPLVLGRAFKLHPLVIVLSLTAGAVIGGIVGAFLAVPITAVAVAMGQEIRAPGNEVGG